MNALSSRQRILSLWLDRLATDRLARQSPELRSPLVVYGKRGNAELIVALDQAAEALGLRGGLALAQARAMHPAITAVPEDTAADSGLLERIADWCLRYTPLVALDGRDGMLLDIGGCAHLYGGEARLVTDLAERFARAGLSHRIAVAGTIGAAYAAARYGEAGLYETGGERAVLGPLPVAALRIEPQVVASLARVGLKRIRDIADLPRAPLAARFGAELLRQLDRALGREHEPLTPRLPVAPYAAEQRFPDPIAREEDVLMVTEKLAARIEALLEQRGDGARHLELILFRTDGALRRICAGTSRPLRNPQAIRALFVERMAALADEYDPGFGFDMMRLSVVAAEACNAHQIGLAGGEDEAEIDRLVDHLSARLGGQRVRRLIAHDSHIPEIASTTGPAQRKPDDDGWAAFRRHRDSHGSGPRPLRLLAKPEPIEAMAQVPDSPPARFTWRNAVHDVVAAEGPERIERTWWNETESRARDYFRVEDKTGLRFWIFRAGLYREFESGKDETPPRWFMHGTFA
ncbi:MAG: DNA polymerase Y family protein [Pseudolabrys sp.]|nr:DNA polymerase Y family protein [Pseudolabrys sp.]